MKALSIHQPWAELILQGRKSIELRISSRPSTRCSPLWASGTWC